MDDEKCAGCGKPSRNRNDSNPSGLVEIEIAPGHTARVCITARSLYKTPEPIESCRDAVLDRSKFCRGCGVEEPAFWSKGHFDSKIDVCPDCRVAMDRGRARQESEPKEWYALMPDEIATYWSHLDSHKAAFAELARSVAGLSGGRTDKPAEAGVAARIPVLEKSSGPYGASFYGAVFVELTANQAESLRRFVEAMRRAVGDAWARGSESGRSILHSLARGELTTSELDDRLVGAAKRERESTDGKR